MIEHELVLKGTPAIFAAAVKAFDEHLFDELSRRFGGARYKVLSETDSLVRVLILPDTPFPADRQRGLVSAFALPANQVRIVFQCTENEFVWANLAKHWTALGAELARLGFVDESPKPQAKRKPGRPTPDLEYKLKLWLEWEEAHGNGQVKRIFCELHGTNSKQLNRWRDDLIKADLIADDRTKPG